MLRSAAALAALLMFPGIVLAQQQTGAGASGQSTPSQAQAAGARGGAQAQGDHTVERGESLWNLSRQYFNDPFQWRRIFDANKDRIDNPHWIYPGQRLVIPGKGTVTVTGVSVQGPGGAQGGARQPAPATTASAVYPGPNDPTVFSSPPRTDIPAPDQRTAFYGALRRQRLTGGAVLAGTTVPHLAVSEDGFYSAPWLVPQDERDEVSYPGRIIGWSGTQRSTRSNASIDPYDRIELDWTGAAAPTEGTLLQMVRVERTERDFGSVIRPTGMARVVERSDSGVVAVVVSAFTRPLVGDYALKAPDFPLSPGRYSQPTNGGLTAKLMGFAVYRTVQHLGDVAFLSAGSDQGVKVGDVFALEVSSGGGWSPQETARFQVVRTFPGRSSARVTNIVSPDFQPGMEVRRIRRMP